MSKKYRIVFTGIASLLAVVGYAAATGSILPTSDGTYTQWTTSTGSTHYTLVDESSCNGTTDYNFTTTVGNRDSYGVSLSSVPNGSKITQISITPCASRNSSGGGSSTMNVFYKFGLATSSADSGGYALTGTTPTQLSATNFSSLSVIKDSGTTLEVGAVYSAGTKGARLSRISTVITYTALAVPTNFLAGTTTSSSIELSWTDTSTIEDGFAIERKNDTAGTPFAGLATTSANVKTYSDTGLDASTSYTYRIRSYNSGGYSAYSTTTSATTNP